MANISENIQNWGERLYLKVIHYPYFYHFLLLGLFGLHGFLRLAHPWHSQFEYDQAMVAFKAVEIVKEHHLTLIGTKVGEFSFYLPPFYLYASALAFWLGQYHPLSLFYEAYVWSVIAFWGLFFMIREVAGKRAALLGVGLYTVSTGLTIFDRIPWNPNLILGPISFAHYFLYRITVKHQRSWYEYTGLIISLSVAAQGHFTAFLVILFALILITGKRAWTPLGLGIVIAGLGLLISPLVLFDIRHNYQNLQGLTALFSNNGLLQDTTFITWLQTLWDQIRVVIENNGKITFEGNLSWTYMALGIIILGSSLYRSHSRYAFTAWLSMTSLFVLMFSLYQGSKPEYYFICLTPLNLLIYAIAMNHIWEQPAARWVAIVVVIFMVQNTWTHLAFSGHSLGDKWAALQYIQTQAKGKPVNLEFVINPAWNVGYDYIVDYMGIQIVPQNERHYKLFYPQNDSLPDGVAFGDIMVQQHFSK